MNEYYRTERWKKLKKKALRYTNNRCRACGLKKNLDVYLCDESKINKERLNNDLVVLCSDCYGKVDKNNMLKHVCEMYDENKTYEQKILEHMYLVEQIATKYKEAIEDNSVLEFDDLIASGNLGLCEGVNTYDATKGDFILWIYRNIVWEIIRQIRTSEWIESRHLAPLVNKMQEEQDKFIEEYNRKPTIKELANTMKLSQKRVRFLSYISGIGIENLLSDDDANDFFGEEDEFYKTFHLLSGLDKLSPFYKEILIRKVFYEDSFSKIAKRLGSTKEYISNDYKRAIELLKEVYSNEA